jgi:CheY-like chemotaxis protein
MKAKANILLVDDEPMLLEIFAHWLTSEGPYHVVIAFDGQAAFEMLQQEDFDLLITDMRMPRMNGVELVRCLATLNKRLPNIVFVSGFGHVDEREMYGLGVEKFLAKPVSREELVTSVEQALAQRAVLWKTRLESNPTQSIVVHATALGNEAASNRLVLGRGGFSARHPDPISLGKVAFTCHLAEPGRTITGEGWVRWRAKAEGRIGIELAYLEADSREHMIGEIESANPRAYIPPW